MKAPQTVEYLQSPLSQRLDWLSVMRGICSLWIVYFHLYTPYFSDPFPKTNSGFFESLSERYQSMEIHWFGQQAGVLHDLLAAMSLHAVGIFILMSGFGLTRSLLKAGDDTIDWKQWLSKRFWRLYPFFWFAHVIFLVAPFIWRPEPVDWRFLVSLTGIRAYPMEVMLFYANPSWWFFWLILQLYLVFPILYRLYRKLSVTHFMFIMLAVTFISRWLILFVWKDWRGMIIGGLFTSRLAEFALGMALADIWRRDPGRFTRRMISWKTLVAGALIYPVGLLCYTSLESYIFVDFLTTLGLFLLASQISHVLCKIPLAHQALAFAGSVSLSTFLLHQPWALTLGVAIAGQPWWVFALTTLLFLPAMVLIAYACEQAVRLAVAKWKRD